MTDYDKDSVSKILEDGHGDWYTAHLFRLILKAQGKNRELLRSIYPEEVRVVENFLGIEGRFGP